TFVPERRPELRTSNDMTDMLKPSAQTGTWRRKAVALALSLSLAGIVFDSAAAAPASAVVPVRAAPAGFAELADQLSNAVVNISTTQVLRRNGGGKAQPQGEDSGSPLDDLFRDFQGNGSGRPRRVSSLGSGFIVDPSGVVVTNNHVIEDADEVTVIF